jgi:hypothetical protein
MIASGENPVIGSIAGLDLRRMFLHLIVGRLRFAQHVPRPIDILKRAYWTKAG